MQTIFKLLLGIAALSNAAKSSAEEFHITGCPEVRALVHNMFRGQSAVRIAHSGSAASLEALNSAEYATFRYGSGNNVTTIYCSWQGSGEGIRAIPSGTGNSYIPATALPTYTENYFNEISNAAINQMPTASAYPNFVISTVFKSSVTNNEGLQGGSRCAVLPYRFLANKGATGITNMTAQQVRALFGNSEQPKSMWTNNHADTDLVLPVGRDTSSGARITVVSETKYGIVIPVQQWKLTTASGAITQAQVWPIEDGIGSTSPGNGGYRDGNLIADLMSKTSTSPVLRLDTAAEVIDTVPVSFISYLAVNDATAAIANGAIPLTYDGSGYSPASVAEGGYTLWSYLHVYTWSASSSQGISLKNSLESMSGDGIIPLSAMNVERTNDGAVVTPL